MSDVVLGSSPRPRVVLVDRRAGLAIGHHQHWLELLLQGLGQRVEVLILRGESHATETLEESEAPTAGARVRVLRQGESTTAWYRNALRVAVATDPQVIIVLSGDDALFALAAEWRACRRVEIRSLFFRLAPQPEPRAMARYAARLTALALLKVALPKLQAHVLLLPVGRSRRTHRLLGLTPVTDASAGEALVPAGHVRARGAVGLAAVTGPVVLVIGMLGPGKHVDTVIEAWRIGALPNGRLIFAGQADRKTDELLMGAAKNRASIEYRPGRLTDIEFDHLLEAADVVCAIYRYSASSGIVLRALALGSPVLVGGSSVLKQALGDIAGVVILQHLDVLTVAEGLRRTASIRRPIPTQYRRPADEFPRPLIKGLPHV